MTNWHIHEQEQACIAALTAAVTDILRQSLDLHGSAALAVSGGKSPIPFFDALSRADLDWAKVTISLVDERFVAPSDPDSNENLVRRHLLVHGARRAAFQGLVSDPDDITACLERANRQPPALTLAILGMGEDGHTASLFPQAPELAQALDPGQSRSYVCITPPAAPHLRISLTLASLLQARNRMLFITGTHKRQVAELAERQADATLPVSFLLAAANAPIDVYWHP